MGQNRDLVFVNGVGIPETCVMEAIVEKVIDNLSKKDKDNYRNKFRNSFKIPDELTSIS